MELTKISQHAPEKMNLEKIEEMVIRQNIAKMSPSEKIMYVKSLNDALGLDWRLNGIGLINLQGKEVPYIQRAGTDQLRQKNKISITITAREKVGDCYIVTARATTPDGRTDESIGVVPLVAFGKTLSGDNLANAFMKAETKAKRRVTLSICGCGFMDESEIETVEGTKVSLQTSKTIQAEDVTTKSKLELESGDLVYDTFENRIEQHINTVNEYDSSMQKKVTEKQLKRLFAISKSANWDDQKVEELVKSKGFDSRKDLTRQAYDEVIDEIQAQPSEMVEWEDMGRMINKEQAFQLYQTAYDAGWTKDAVTQELQTLGFSKASEIAFAQLEDLKSHFQNIQPKG